ncbi:hypothetical protein JAG45_002235 [Providencia rettgeri]|nr:hypothetical protein [Providencia rettgeri]
MEFKGTPAPWDVDDCGHYYDIIRKGDNSLGYMELLDSKKFGKEISAANAHLISAAPELLSELIRLRNIVASYKQDSGDNLDITDSVIAKALGQQ